ncbi:lipopolysaccharide biosynthesis protein, partial [Bacteroides fragilis]
KFYICKFKLLWKWRLNKELLSFSGWDSIAWVSGSASFNIINILLNIFLGTIVNAAYGIATQISGLISQLINSFQNAINPQIVKLYAKNENVNLYKLMCNSCKYSCVLVSFFAIPIYLRVEYFLSIWLGDYPNLTPEFARIMIVQSLIIGFTRPIVNSVHATAKLKYPCIFSSLIFLFIIPLAALLLYLKVEPTIVMSINVLPWFLEGMVNMYFVRKYLGVDISTFPNKVILITLMIIAVTWSLTYFMSCILPEGLIYSIILIVFSIIIGATSTYVIGFDSDTKRMIKNRLIAFSSK